MVALTVAAIALSVLVQGLSSYANYFIHLRDKITAQTLLVGELTHKSMDNKYILPEYVDIGDSRWQVRYDEKEYFFKDIEGLKEARGFVYDESGNLIISLTTIIYTQ